MSLISRLICICCIAVVVAAQAEHRSENEQIPIPNTAQFGSDGGQLSPDSPPHHILPCDPSLDTSTERCGLFRVPLDWNDSSAGYGYVRFNRSPAKNPHRRKGTVFVLPGRLNIADGPGQTLTLFTLGGDFRRRLGGDYDVVTWIPRGLPGGTIPGDLQCFDNVNDMSDFYNLMMTGFEDPGYVPQWDEDMRWTHRPDEADARAFFYAQERVVGHCLEHEAATRKMMQYVGTAATTRDLVAMADAFDGPTSPIRFLGLYEGAIVGSHLIAMFPERAGNVVLYDPLDPVKFTEEVRDNPWFLDIELSSDTLKYAAEDCMMGFTEACSTEALALKVSAARENLIGWQTTLAVDMQNAHNQEFFNEFRWESQLQGLDPENFEQYSRRISSHTSQHIPLGLGSMPVICGDLKYEHNSEEKNAMRETIEHSLHHWSLLMPSVLPSWEYLCALWPVRAVERVDLHIKENVRPAQSMLVALRHSGPSKYFGMDTDAVVELWYDADIRIIDDIGDGESVLRDEARTLDIIAQFLVDGSVPPDVYMPFPNTDAWNALDGEGRRHLEWRHSGLSIWPRLRAEGLLPPQGV